jgi:hypothetical protein
MLIPVPAVQICSFDVCEFATTRMCCAATMAFSRLSQFGNGTRAASVAWREASFDVRACDGV